LPSLRLLRWGQPRRLRVDFPKSQAVRGREGSTWYHHACGRLLKGTTTTTAVVINVMKSKMVVKAVKVTVVIAGELAFHRVIAKKNKGHSSSVITNTFRLGLCMIMAENKSEPKLYHNNLAMAAMPLQNTRFMRTCHSDSC
jgi:hypothetical protein